MRNPTWRHSIWARRGHCGPRLRAPPPEPGHPSLPRAATSCPIPPHLTSPPTVLLALGRGQRAPPLAPTDPGTQGPTRAAPASSVDEAGPPSFPWSCCVVPRLASSPTILLALGLGRRGPRLRAPSSEPRPATQASSAPGAGREGVVGEGDAPCSSHGRKRIGVYWVLQQCSWHVAIGRIHVAIVCRSCCNHCEHVVVGFLTCCERSM